MSTETNAPLCCTSWWAKYWVLYCSETMSVLDDCFDRRRSRIRR